MVLTCTTKSVVDDYRITFEIKLVGTGVQASVEIEVDYYEYPFFKSILEGDGQFWAHYVTMLMRDCIKFEQGFVELGHVYSNFNFSKSSVCV